MQTHFIKGEPHLMPHQEIAFNGDEYICLEFIKLKDRFQIATAIETGSAVGGTTNWLAGNFEKVYSIEINETYLEFAKQRCSSHSNIVFYKGDSPRVLSYTLNRVGDRTIYFLDAHWQKDCPLKKELAAIAKAGIKPVIAIHDFKVPGTSLGFDSYNGQPFTIEWIAQDLDSIYGADDYEYYYNSDEMSGGAKRGIIYITPKQ